MDEIIYGSITDDTKYAPLAPDSAAKYAALKAVIKDDLKIADNQLTRRQLPLIPIFVNLSPTTMVMHTSADNDVYDIMSDIKVMLL